MGAGKWPFPVEQKIYIILYIDKIFGPKTCALNKTYTNKTINMAHCKVAATFSDFMIFYFYLFQVRINISHIDITDQNTEKLCTLSEYTQAHYLCFTEDATSLLLIMYTNL